jgi:hypothetical protein
MAWQPCLGCLTTHPYFGTLMKRSIVLALLTLSAACAEKKAATTDTVQPATTAAAATTPPAMPTVIIASPAEGDSTGHDVTVVLSKQNVTIAKADAARLEGTGHYHLFLDTIPTMDTLPIPPTTKTVVHIGTGDSTFTFKGLKPGPHRIIALIGYGNHVPMPSVLDTVNFVVKP